MSDPLEPTGGAEDERFQPELGRLGSIWPGQYLFSREALGTNDAHFSAATLVRVEPDSFVVSVAGGAHREVAKSEAWPMACLSAPLDMGDGALQVHLDVGSPVFVLASSSSAARVGVSLDTERSQVVPRTSIATDGCAPPEVGEAPSRVGAAAGSDVACVFSDRDSLDETDGVPVASGAPVSVTRTDGDWASVRVELRGGRVEGWMPASLIDTASESSPDVRWTRAALSRGRCVHPARGSSPPSTGPITLDPDEGPTPSPAIPEVEIERVVHAGETQVHACYEARLAEVPDLRVTLEVLLLVDADGHVEDARLTRGANADPGLTRCVVERVRRWRFPAPRTGSVQVRRSFDLRPPSP